MANEINISPSALRSAARQMNAPVSSLSDVKRSLNKINGDIGEAWVSQYTDDYKDRVEQVIRKIQKTQSEIESIQRALRRTADRVEELERQLAEMFSKD